MDRSARPHVAPEGSAGPARAVRRGSFTVPCDPATALPLFTPEGERRWVEGWQPEYLSGADDEVGAVWRTAHDDEVTWITTDRDDDRVRYARVSGNGTAGLVEVRCSPAGGGTRVQVTYDLTACTAAGFYALQRFATHFEDMLEHWRRATAAVLAGTPVSGGAGEHGRIAGPAGGTLDAGRARREHRERRQEALMEPVVGARDPGLDGLRRVRAELAGSMAALEQALAAPTPGRSAAWAERVDVALVELSADFAEHVAVTEGSDGLHDALLEAAPRLSNSIHRLAGEHAVISGLVRDLLAQVTPPVAADDIEAIRDLGTALLGRLARHRQRGADLVYQAYEVDLGGET